MCSLCPCLHIHSNVMRCLLEFKPFFLNHVCVAVVMEVDKMETRMSALQESGERLEIKRETESDEERDDDGKHMIVLIE